MKYYINRTTRNILKDENNYTPYLKDRGYEEITEAEYSIIEAELIENSEEGDD